MVQRPAPGKDVFPPADPALDFLIARSGIIGRQILRLCRFMREGGGVRPEKGGGVPGFWLRRFRVHAVLRATGIARLFDLLYTYWVGGSLTRQDQLTFARIHGMREEAHLLTLLNALCCGIPCALWYFLVGEGFSLLAGVHSYVELPSLFARNVFLGIGLISLGVDLFRAWDAYWNRRCWAPFGLMPAVINLPTYLKRLARGRQ